MQTIKKQLIKKLALLCCGLLFIQSVQARTDTEAQENYAKALAKSHQQEMDHSAHANHDKSLDFHGIFYGYLPCNDCDGVKTTLSLKQKKNYLLVTQPARDSIREFYEKGKYEWNEETGILVLTSRKDGSKKQYRIIDEGAIVQLNSDGSSLPEDLVEEYTLRRSDTVKSREVHIH